MLLVLVVLLNVGVVLLVMLFVLESLLLLFVFKFGVDGVLGGVLFVGGVL